jgi:hypothetical protein
MAEAGPDVTAQGIETLGSEGTVDEVCGPFHQI